MSLFVLAETKNRSRAASVGDHRDPVVHGAPHGAALRINCKTLGSNVIFWVILSQIKFSVEPPKKFAGVGQTSEVRIGGAEP